MKINETDRTNFLAWLVEDVEEVSAEANSPRDTNLKDYERAGMLTFSGCYHGTNFYKINGSAALYGTPIVRRNET